MLSMEGDAFHDHFFPKKPQGDSHCDRPLGAASGLNLKPVAGAIDENHPTCR